MSRRLPLLALADLGLPLSAVASARPALEPAGRGRVFVTLSGARLAALLKEKSRGGELGKAPADAELGRFLERSFAELPERVAALPARRPPREGLDRLIAETLG